MADEILVRFWVGYKGRWKTMDKIYIDSKGKNTTVELPKYGEVTLVIQDGKVMRLETKTTQKLA